MVANINPMPPAMIPLRASSPLRAATKVIPKKRKEEKNRRAKGKTKGKKNGTRRPQDTPEKPGPNKRANEHTPQGAPRLAVASHGVAIDNSRCGGRLARHAKQNRRNVACR